MAGTDATAVLIKVPVQDVVAAVFDRPVTAVDLQQALRIGLLGRSAGDAVGKFAAVLAGFFVQDFAFDDEGLGDVGEIKVSVQCSGGPDAARLDRKSTRLNSSHIQKSRMPSSA